MENLFFCSNWQQTSRRGRVYERLNPPTPRTGTLPNTLEQSIRTRPSEPYTRTQPLGAYIDDGAWESNLKNKRITVLTCPNHSVTSPLAVFSVPFPSWLSAAPSCFTDGISSWLVLGNKSMFVTSFFFFPLPLISPLPTSPPRP